MVNPLILVCALSEHHWGQLEYESQSSCKLARVCQRCRLVDRDQWGERHIWTDWGSEVSALCGERGRCNRCNRTAQRAAHIWGEWCKTKDACKKFRLCSICAGSEERFIHSWELSEDVSCSTCGGYGYISTEFSSSCSTCGGSGVVGTVDKCSRCGQYRNDPGAIATSAVLDSQRRAREREIKLGGFFR